MHQLHPAPAIVFGRTDAELFLAGYAERSRRDAESFADLGRPEHLLRLSLQQRLEAGRDVPVFTCGAGGLDR